MKRRRHEYDDDDKLLHQATKTLMREAKRVKTFFLQQALRKHKALATRKREAGAGGEDPTGGVSLEKSATSQRSGGEEAREAGVPHPLEPPASVRAPPQAPEGIKNSSLSPASIGIPLIKEMQPLAVVKICLRRLGLAHTGLEGENEVEVKGSAELKLLLRHVLAHKRVEAVMEELQERVTQRRREKLADSEGRPPPRKARGGRGREGGAATASSAAENGGRQVRRNSQRRSSTSAGGKLRPFSSSTGSAAFVSLSGETPLDEEWSPGSIVASKKYSAKASQSARRKEDGGSRASSATTKTRQGRVNEPGWAGANREAGWGRGGGRSRNGGNREGRGGGRGKGVSQQDGTPGGRSGVARSGKGVGGAGGGIEGVADKRSSPSTSSGQREIALGVEDLHGSWAAKRALKEREASATKAFSGKKITFGDDD